VVPSNLAQADGLHPLLTLNVNPKTGLVLVYVGTQSHWLAGAGWVILYKYEKGELKEISKVMMWIS
jgi:hypothetical protein